MQDANQNANQNAANLIPCPFTILIDSAETQPWTFTGIRADARDIREEIEGCNYRLDIPTRWEPLGRHPNSLGDYSIDGFKGIVGVERKSCSDIWSTVMGWGKAGESNADRTHRRTRFKCELENLSKLKAACVIIESSLGDCLHNPPEYGKRDDLANRKIFHRSVLGMMQDFRVPWIFCDGRRLAEVTAFRYLERFWRHAMEDARKAAKAAKKAAKTARQQSSRVAEQE